MKTENELIEVPMFCAHCGKETSHEIETIWGESIEVIFTCEACAHFIKHPGFKDNAELEAFLKEHMEVNIAHSVMRQNVERLNKILSAS
jgi:uncharacterized Zn finger protein